MEESLFSAAEIHSEVGFDLTNMSAFVIITLRHSETGYFCFEAQESQILLAQSIEQEG